MTQYQFEQSEQDLVYSNTAFVYFLIAINVLACRILVIPIASTIYSWRKPSLYSKILKHSPSRQLYQQKIWNSWAFRKKTRQYNKLVILISIFVIGLITLALLVQILSGMRTTELSGFDPYQILGIDRGSDQRQIKKVYRKLVLQYHPDRLKQQVNHLSKNKFDRIIKAYKCLTDQRAKENCLKYGNPDRQLSYKFGIGLPEFLMYNQKSDIFLVCFGLIMLLILGGPFWLFESYIAKCLDSRRIDRKSSKYRSAVIMHSLLNPEVNIIKYCIIYGCTQQLQQVYNRSNRLNEKKKQEVVSILREQGKVAQNIIQMLDDNQMYRVYMVLCYLNYIAGADRQDQLKISYRIPEATQKIIKHSLYYARRPQKNQQYTLLQDCQQLRIDWYGLVLAKRAIEFSQMIYNRNTNIQADIISDHIKFGVEVSAKLTLDQKQISEMTVDDIAYINIRVSKVTQGSDHDMGYVLCHNYPFLSQQKFVMVVTRNSSLLYSSIFQFQSVSRHNNRNMYNHKYQYKDIEPVSNNADLCAYAADVKLRKLKQGQHSIFIRLYSLNYPSISVQKQVTLYVYARLQVRQVFIHQQDRMLQRIQKDFFQRFITFYQQNPSDVQLSDSQAQLQQQKQRGQQRNQAKQFNKKAKKMENGNNEQQRAQKHNDDPIKLKEKKKYKQVKSNRLNQQERLTKKRMIRENID